jgi:ferredoxin-type protein NapH
MIGITPYLGILVLIVSIGGIWYPKLGYFLLLVFAGIFLFSPFRGRWFCGNLCPRGSFNDFWLSKITRGKRIPKDLRSMWIRIPIFILLMGFMIYRVIQTEGVVDKVGMVFVTMCIMTTAAAIVFGILYSPRAWCSFCPMGTMQRLVGARKMQINVDLSKCTKCGICLNACPMHLTVNQLITKPDCIKCGRCVEACPKGALKF